MEEVRSTEPAGIVVGQSPAGGSSAPQGAVVTLRVSNGKTPAATVPDVVGLTEGAAKARLSAAGFRTNVGTQPTGKKALDGMVGSQSPGGGTSLASGSAVSITVYDYVKPKNEGGGTGAGKGAGKNDGKDDDGKGGGGSGGGGSGGGSGGGGGGARRGEDDRERPDR